MAVPFDAALQSIIPSDDVVDKLLGNSPFYEFDEKASMDQTVKRLAGVEKRAVDSGAMFNLVIDCFTEAEQCMRGG